MVTESEQKRFNLLWEDNKQDICNFLRKKFSWKKFDNPDLRQDIMSEAKLLCLSKLNTYNPEKSSPLVFFITWSQIAYKRFIFNYNKTVLGNSSFRVYRTDIQVLTEIFKEEGNPRFLLIFIYHRYLEISPKQFISSGFTKKTLWELFQNAKSELISKLSPSRSREHKTEIPSWLIDKFNYAFDILEAKIINIKDQTFFTGNKDHDRSYNIKAIFEWSDSVKNSFLNLRAENKNKYPNNADEIENTDFPVKHKKAGYLEEIVATDSPIEFLFAIEQNEMYIMLLSYCIKKTKKLNYLFAFLFHICKITPKEFKEKKLYTLTTHEIVNQIVKVFLSKTKIPGDQIRKIFKMLECKIETHRNAFLFNESDGKHLSDWFYKTKISIKDQVFYSNDPEARVFRSYYLFPKSKRDKNNSKINH